MKFCMTSLLLIAVLTVSLTSTTTGKTSIFVQGAQQASHLLRRSASANADEDSQYHHDDVAADDATEFRADVVQGRQLDSLAAQYAAMKETQSAGGGGDNIFVKDLRGGKGKGKGKGKGGKGKGRSRGKGKGYYPPGKGQGYYPPGDGGGGGYPPGGGGGGGLYPPGGGGGYPPPVQPPLPPLLPPIIPPGKGKGRRPIGKGKGRRPIGKGHRPGHGGGGHGHGGSCKARCHRMNGSYRQRKSASKGAMVAAVGRRSPVAIAVPSPSTPAAMIRAIPIPATATAAPATATDVRFHSLPSAATSASWAVPTPTLAPASVGFPDMVVTA